jgi:hypothetical protein
MPDIRNVRQHRREVAGAHSLVELRYLTFQQSQWIAHRTCF